MTLPMRTALDVQQNWATFKEWLIRLYDHTADFSYYGQFASDPTTNPLGGPMVAGDTYYNTSVLYLKVYNGTNWERLAFEAAAVAAVEAARTAAESAIADDVDAVNERRDEAIETDIPNAINTLLDVNNRGDWAPLTAYTTEKQIVRVIETVSGETTTTWYLCVVAHTSSTSFAVDGPLYWVVWQNYNPSISVLPLNIDADLMSDTNVNIPNPALTSGVFVMDGETVGDTYTVFLPSQTDPVQNGPWQYASATNTLTRPPTYYNGLLVGQPTQVNVLSGDMYTETSWEMVSPAVATVGVNGTTWAEAAGAESQVTGTSLMGPSSAGKLEAIPTWRRLSTTDMPWYMVQLSTSAFRYSPYAHLNPWGYMSRYIEADNPWSNVAAFNACVNERNVIFVDCPLTFRSQPTASLSNKTLIFLGEHSKITQISLTSSLFDLGGVKNLTVMGNLVYEVVAFTGGSIKAIKGTGFSNVRFERISTKNVTNAVHVDGTIDGLFIDTIAVSNLATETPLTIADASATGSKRTVIRRIENKPIVEYVPLSAAYTYRAYASPEVMIVNGAMTANRDVTLSLQNASEGKRGTVKHAATGGFSIVIKDSVGTTLKTITNGQTADFVMSSGAWVITN